MGKKRLVISLLLTIFFVFLLQPFYSTGNLLTSFLATKNHKLYRMDVFASGASTNKVELVSHTPNAVFQSPNWFKNPKWRKDKGNGSLIHGALKSKWQDCLIKLKVKGDGKLFISLRGEDKRINGKRYPVLVDYKKLVVNGKPVLLGRKTIWHDRPFNYSLSVKNGDVVTLEVTARTHHFRWSDLRYVYDVNFKILFTVFILSFLFSYKFVQYVARFKILEHHSRIDIVFLCAFFALLFVPMLKINPADKSLQENRMLAKYPALFVSNGLNLKFGSLFEKWFNDRFWGREWLIDLNTFIISKFNGLQGNEKVLVGRDGWLFYKADNGINNYRNIDLFTEEELKKIAKYLSDIDGWSKKNGKKFYYMICPDKNKIYGEYFANVHKDNPDTKSRAFQLISYLKRYTQVSVIYPYDVLIKNKNKTLLYWKNDTHWTELGGYYGYVTLMKEINTTFSVDIKKYDKLVSRYYPKGDLNKMYPIFPEDISTKYLVPNFIDTAKCDSNYRDRKDTRCYNHEGTKKIVLFRDSFTSRMAPYLNSTFREVFYFWRYDIHESDLPFLKEHSDVIVLAHVERFIVKLKSLNFPAKD